MRTEAARPTPGRVAARPVEARATSATPRQAMPGDRLAPSGARALEADVHVKIDGRGRLVPDGQVTLSRDFIYGLLAYVTRKSASLGPIKATFNPASGDYDGKVQVRFKGLSFALSGKMRPVVDGHQVGFAIDRPRLALGKLRIPLPSRLLTRLIAKEIASSGIQSSAERNVVRLDVSSLLHDIGALPRSLHIDPVASRVAVTTASSGDVSVRFAGSESGPAVVNTPDSDLTLRGDARAVRDALAPLLAPDFELTDVTLGTDRMLLSGRVEAKPLSNAVNAAKLFGALLAIAGGRNPGPVGVEKVKLALKLDLRFNGTQVVLTPSLRPALGDLEKTLTKAGAAPVREGNSLRFDLLALSSKAGLQAFRVTSEAVEARSRLDIPGFFSHPLLTGQQKP